MEDYFSKITKYYTPSLPIQSEENFFGRKIEKSHLYKSLLSPGRQSLIYGERGVGKTSLINIVTEYFCNSNEYISIRHTCGKNDTFEKIFATLFADSGEDEVLTDKTERNALNSEGKLKIPGLEIGKEKVSEKEFNYHKITETKITPQLIASRFKTKKIAFNIDEFDRIEGIKTIQQIAETIKALSDSNCSLKLIISGVSTTSRGLIGEHASIKRNLLPISVKRMQDYELEEIIEFGAKNLGLQFDEIVKKTIAHLSSGLPYFTHFLSENLADNAHFKKKLNISIYDLIDIISTLLKNDIFEDSKELVSSIIIDRKEVITFATFSDDDEFVEQKKRSKEEEDYYLKLILFICPFLDKINETNSLNFIQTIDSNKSNIKIEEIQLTDITIALEFLSNNTSVLVKLDDNYYFQDAFLKAFIFLRAFEFFEEEKISKLLLLQNINRQ